MAVRFNPLLHARVNQVQQSIRFATTNLGNGVNEQKIKPWDPRAARHLENFHTIRADIMALQEFRSFAENAIQPEDFVLMLQKHLKHEVVYAKRNASALPLNQAITFDTTKFFLKQTRRWWLSDTPADLSDDYSDPAYFGSLLLGVELYHVQDNKVVMLDDGSLPTLWVFCAHFLLSESVKTRQARKLVDIVREVVKDKPFVVMGDFNTFESTPDRPTEGKLQLNTLMQGLRAFDATATLQTLDGETRAGTFLGYDSDPFKQDPEQLSHLDHMFFSPHFTQSDVSTLYATAPELRARSTPSDHITCVAAVVVKLE